ncbi:spore germination protein KC [Paenibacillus catalpae]|uniref:Spore germination protein KC n=1 Tax=Paenibacillus catalpae TaxID=1045775 RepID=A0A1I1V038_9BACL|nr:Ger(x)C family spore germination protein [Paenibacillus catalpae]SFD76165.1 spore germination protein KC [Paenibacillus catalpae]
MRTLKCTFLFLVMFIVSGCWDRMEINDLAFVTGTALDLTEDGKLLCTLQIAIPGPKEGGGSSGGSGHMGNFYVITATGKNGTEIHRSLQKKSSRRLFFSHRSVVLISERLAKQGIHDALLDVFTHDPRNRLKTYLVLVKGGEARNILELKYPLKQVPIEAVNEMQISGDDLAVTLRDFFIMNQSEGIQPVLGAVELGDHLKDPNEQIFKFAGTGVLKDLKLAGILDENETLAMMWVTDKLKFGRITTKLPKDNGEVGMMLNHTDSKIKTKIERNSIKFKILLEGTGVIEENNSTLDIDDPEQLKIIKKALEETVEDRVQQLLFKFQKKYKVDSVGFGQEIYKNNPGKWRQLRNQWDTQFQEASISVDVNLTINGAGMVHSILEKQE